MYQDKNGHVYAVAIKDANPKELYDLGKGFEYTTNFLPVLFSDELLLYGPGEKIRKINRMKSLWKVKALINDIEKFCQMLPHTNSQAKDELMNIQKEARQLVQELKGTGSEWKRRDIIMCGVGSVGFFLSFGLFCHNDRDFYPLVGCIIGVESVKGLCQFASYALE